MLEIKTLDLGSALIGHGRLVQSASADAMVSVPVKAFLIIGGDDLIMVDTGFRNTEILRRIGCEGVATHEQSVEAQLALHGLKMSDVRYVLHTHLHIDHSGQLEKFPATTTAVLNRKELEYSVSGLSGASYPPEDVKHLIDRLHQKDGLWLLDLEDSGSEMIIDGVRCEAAGGHTEGSMTIWVDTADGLACLCGDVIYRVEEQLFSSKPIQAQDPVISGNTVVSRRSEKASMKRVINGADIVYPSHDAPFRVVGGRPKLI